VTFASFCCAGGFESITVFYAQLNELSRKLVTIIYATERRRRYPKSALLPTPQESTAAKSEVNPIPLESAALLKSTIGQHEKCANQAPFGAIFAKAQPTHLTAARKLPLFV
jgi:hypothetical protein